MKTVHIQQYLAIISFGICVSGMLVRFAAGIF
jgi:hypothetical protein